MEENYKSLELSIKANCMRIIEILDKESLIEVRDSPYYCQNTTRVELKQRMAQLRKDTNRAHKIIYREEEY